jgi:hypothetical protein
MKNVWRRESLMKSVLLFFAMTMMAIVDPLSAQAQTTTADAQTPFQLELARVLHHYRIGGPGGDAGRQAVRARRPLILREAGCQ